jgi:hypothetical protein
MTLEEISSGIALIMTSVKKLENLTSAELIEELSMKVKLLESNSNSSIKIDTFTRASDGTEVRFPLTGVPTSNNVIVFLNGEQITDYTYGSGTITIPYVRKDDILKVAYNGNN